MSVNRAPKSGFAAEAQRKVSCSDTNKPKKKHFIFFKILKKGEIKHGRKPVTKYCIRR